MVGPMAYSAPGQRRRTAWASTWLVEWRMTSRPSGLVAVTMATWSPSCRGRVQVDEAAVGLGRDGGFRQSRPDRLRGVERGRAVGEFERGAVGKGDVEGHACTGPLLRARAPCGGC